MSQEYECLWAHRPRSRHIEVEVRALALHVPYIVTSACTIFLSSVVLEAWSLTYYTRSAPRQSIPLL